MASLNIRSLDEVTMMYLRKEAKQQHVSINTLVLQLLKRGLGLSHEYETQTYHDLDHLAGTWSKEDVKQFNAATKAFEKIDKELWS